MRSSGYIKQAVLTVLAAGLWGVAPPAVAAEVDVVGDSVVVAGDAGDERIAVACAGGMLQVNGGPPADDPACPDARLTLKGRGGDDSLEVDTRGFARHVEFLLQGGRDADRLMSGPGGLVVMAGGPGRDALLGGRAGEDMIGGRGSDLIKGRGGKDQMFGDEGRDRLVGGKAGDIAFGGPGGDRVIGGAGQDVLEGNGGRDRVNGGRARDRCRTGPGDRLRNCEKTTTGPILGRALRHVGRAALVN